MERRAVPSHEVQARTEVLDLLETAQRIMANSQLAAIKADQASPGRRRRCPTHNVSGIRCGARRRTASEPVALNSPACKVLPRRSAEAEPVSRGAMLRDFFRGQSWWPHVAVQGPGQVTCLRCGQVAASWSHLSGFAYPGWSTRLPARAQATLLLGDVSLAGGGAAEFASLVAQRLARLPRAPD